MEWDVQGGLIKPILLSSPWYECFIEICKNKMDVWVRGSLEQWLEINDVSEDYWKSRICLPLNVKTLSQWKWRSSGYRFYLRYAWKSHKKQLFSQTIKLPSSSGSKTHITTTTITKCRREQIKNVIILQAVIFIYFFRSFFSSSRWGRDEVKVMMVCGRNKQAEILTQTSSAPMDFSVNQNDLDFFLSLLSFSRLSPSSR